LILLYEVRRALHFDSRNFVLEVDLTSCFWSHDDFGLEGPIKEQEFGKAQSHRKYSGISSEQHFLQPLEQHELYSLVSR
jgi:hypothetical protein